MAEAPRTRNERPRDYPMEAELCQAIGRRFVLLLRYEGDVRYRLFLPYAVFHGPDERVLLDGVQIIEMNQPQDEADMWTLEVSRIVDIRVMDRAFTPREGFRITDTRYAGGVICSVSDAGPGTAVH
jgi:hypothetical protein